MLFVAAFRRRAALANVVLRTLMFWPSCLHPADSQKSQVAANASV
jgi:hypothetical protein